MGPHLTAPRLLWLFVVVPIGRDGQGERRSGSGLAPHADAAVVIGRDVFDDGQPQPTAAGGARTRLVAAEEPLEDPFLIFERDSDAPVGDGDLDVVPAAA